MYVHIPLNVEWILLIGKYYVFITSSVGYDPLSSKIICNNTEAEQLYSVAKFGQYNKWTAGLATQAIMKSVIVDGAVARSY